MSKKVLYASDLDRTLIFSERFIFENPTSAKYSPVEYKEDRIISYMSNDVNSKLHCINDNKKVQFVPVTTRSLSEYKRVNLGFTPEYAIVANGAIILHNGEVMEEWNDYIKSKLDYTEVLDLSQDICDLIDSLVKQPKLIDNSYLFFKINDQALFDEEVVNLINRYPNWTFTRQVNKCYAIPNHFSKQIALRWLWHKLNHPYIVASGDSELDLPMLTLANRAIIPSHGSLVKDGFVTQGTFADGGITSPLFTMSIVEESIK